MHIDSPFPLKLGRQECLKHINFDSNNLIDEWSFNKDIVRASKIWIYALSLID